MSTVTKSPSPIKVTQVLFFINAAIWLLFGAVSLIRMVNNSSQIVATLIISIFMLGNVGAMLIAGVGIAKRNQWSYYFGLAVLAINIVLTITDEFGVFDLLTLIIDLVLLGLLIVTKSFYHRSTDDNSLAKTGARRPFVPPGGIDDHRRL